jgi:hypothetical protein
MMWWYGGWMSFLMLCGTLVFVVGLVLAFVLAVYGSRRVRA